jgi:hypothetical protein
MANQFLEDVNALTEQKIAKHVVDVTLKENPLVKRLLSKSKTWKGVQHQFPFKYQSGTPAKGFIGNDTLNQSPSHVLKLAAIDPKFMSKNVNITWTDAVMNANTGAEVLNLVDTKLKMAGQEFADELGTIIYGDGSGDDSKVPMGLMGIIDDGSNLATYASISRASYPTMQSNVLDAGGTLTLSKMRATLNLASESTLEPTIIVTNKAGFANYEALLTPMQRQMSFDKASTGAITLEYAGIPVLRDNKSPNGYFWFINEDYLDWYGIDVQTDTKLGFSAKPLALDTSSIVGNVYGKGGGQESTNLGFLWTGFIPSQNQMAANGNIILAGNLISEAPARHAVMKNAFTI